MAEFKAALDLMRRLPPRDIEKNLGNTLALAPDLVEDLLSAVDQVPLCAALTCYSSSPLRGLVAGALPSKPAQKLVAC